MQQADLRVCKTHFESKREKRCGNKVSTCFRPTTPLPNVNLYTNTPRGPSYNLAH